MTKSEKKSHKFLFNVKVNSFSELKKVFYNTSWKRIVDKKE